MLDIPSEQVPNKRSLIIPEADHQNEMNQFFDNLLTEKDVEEHGGDGLGNLLIDDGEDGGDP